MLAWWWIYELVNSGLGHLLIIYEWIFYLYVCKESSSQVILLQQMGTNAETHNWTTCRVTVLGTHSPKWDDFIKPLSSSLKELCRRGSGRIKRARGDRWHQGNFQMQQDWYMYELIETMAACRGSTQDQADRFPASRTRHEHNPPTSKKTTKLPPSDNHLQKKDWFSPVESERGHKPHSQQAQAYY